MSNSVMGLLLKVGSYGKQLVQALELMFQIP